VIKVVFFICASPASRSSELAKPFEISLAGAGCRDGVRRVAVGC
jgi:hypothetical protein